MNQHGRRVSKLWLGFGLMCIGLALFIATGGAHAIGLGPGISPELMPLLVTLGLLVSVVGLSIGILIGSNWNRRS